MRRKTQPQQSQQKKGSNPTVKYLLLSLGVIALGTGGYFLFKRILKKNSDDDIQSAVNRIGSGEDELVIPAPSSSSSSTPVISPSYSAPSYNPAPQNSSFPLKKKSKGTLVKDIQMALIRQYGASILPKWGADGDYGTELETALISKGLPTLISSEDYAKIIIGKPSTTSSSNSGKDDDKDSKGDNQEEISSPALSKKLHTAIQNESFETAIGLLKRIKDTNKYIKVNEIFKSTNVNFSTKDGYIYVTKMTLVNALLKRFFATSEKKKLNDQFHRIGLKFDGSKWSLAGFSSQDNRLITIKATKVWNNTGTSVFVPSSTILGTFRRAKNGICELQTIDGKTLYVNTTAIRYIS